VPVLKSFFYIKRERERERDSEFMLGFVGKNLFALIGSILAFFGGICQYFF
jgi:hypothetical protein